MQRPQPLRKFADGPWRMKRTTCSRASHHRGSTVSTDAKPLLGSWHGGREPAATLRPLSLTVPSVLKPRSKRRAHDAFSDSKSEDVGVDVGVELLCLKGQDYVQLVDCRSRFAGVMSLRSTTAPAVTAPVRSVFARHGIPRVVLTQSLFYLCTSSWLRTRHQQCLIPTVFQGTRQTIAP